MQGIGVDRGNYWREIWRRRYFWTALALNDLRNRYRRSILGVGWSLLHPIAMSLVLAVAFGKIFNVNVMEFLPYLLAGTAIWNYICSSINEGCIAFVKSEGYIRSHNAPLTIYAFRASLTVGFHFLVTLFVTIAFMMCVGRWPFSVAALTLIPSLLLLFLFGFSVVVLCGFATVYFPDSQHLSTVGLQILFYLTPVMYPPVLLDAKPGLREVLALNPLGSYITIVRDPLMYGRIPDAATYATAALLSTVLFAGACYVLRRCQNSVVLHL